MKVYLASPLGFAASTEAFMQEMVETLAGVGVDVRNPWSHTEFGMALREADTIADRAARIAAMAQINTTIGHANAESIRECDAVVAVLDGVDVDSGTASEIGFAFALGKRIYGLRTDFRLSADNDGSIVNLQVQYFIEASGGKIVRHLDEVVAFFT